jgi:hypothetical protein
MACAMGNNSSIPINWLKPLNDRWIASSTNQFVENTKSFPRWISKDFNISSNKKEELRGSPSLVGRGIANPMSERTRGFELPVKGTKFPLPALLLLS